MVIDDFIMIPCRNGSKRWIRSTGTRYEIKIPYDECARARLIETIADGSRFENAMALAESLVSIRMQLEAMGLVTVLCGREFHSWGHELLIASRPPLHASADRVRGVVESRVEREIRNIQYRGFGSLATGRSRSTFEQSVSVASAAYFGTEGHEWKATCLPVRNSDVSVLESIDRLVYMRRTLWVEIAGVIGFRFLNGRFIDDIAPRATGLDRTWFVSLCEGVADAMDEGRNVDFVDSKVTHLRSLRMLRTCFKKHELFDEWLSAFEAGEVNDLCELADFVRDGVGTQFDVSPHNDGVTIIIPIDSLLPAEFVDTILGMMKITSQSVREAIESRGTRGVPVVDHAPSREPGSTRILDVPDRRVANTSDCVESITLTMQPTQVEVAEILKSTAPVELPKRTGRRGPWTDADMIRVRAFFDRIAAFEVGALILASEIYVATGFDSGSIWHHVNREKGPFLDCLLDRHSLSPVDNKTWRYTRESVLRWLVKAHRFVDDDRLKSLGAIPAKHANAIERRTKPKPKRKG